MHMEFAHNKFIIIIINYSKVIPLTGLFLNRLQFGNSQAGLKNSQLSDTYLAHVQSPYHFQQPFSFLMETSTQRAW